MAFFTTHFFADTLGLCTRANVILPDRPQPGRKIPALYLLHGLSDDETIWMRRTAIERYVSQYYLAVIMPYGDRAFYTDLPNGSRYYTFISDELPRLMESYFPLSNERNDRFISGLSMGGYGAFKCAFANPDKYAAVAGMSSVCHLDWCSRDVTPLYKAIFPDGKPAEHDNIFTTSSKTAALPAADRPKVFQYCGVDDFLWKDNLDLRRHLTELGYDYTWEEGPGGHCWDNWDERIRHILKWLPLEENKVKTGAIGI